MPSERGVGPIHRRSFEKTDLWHLSPAASGSPRANHAARAVKEKKKQRRGMHLILASFLLCSSPGNVSVMLLAYPPDPARTTYRRDSSDASHWATTASRTRASVQPLCKPTTDENAAHERRLCAHEAVCVSVHRTSPAPPFPWRAERGPSFSFPPALSRTSPSAAAARTKASRGHTGAPLRWRMSEAGPRAHARTGGARTTCRGAVSEKALKRSRGSP